MGVRVDAVAGAPSGTVTWLFTDIEGSTRRWESSPQEMSRALARHDAIVLRAIGERAGYVFKTVGDAVCCAFQDASRAADAACAIQRSLAEEAEALSGLRVRIALHAGVAEQRDGDYFGPPLNRVARLLAAGHGGQVLLSSVVAELVRDSLPTGVWLRDLGTHRLKDLSRPEQIHQLVIGDLTPEFPPLRTLDTLRHNLPVQLSSFIGREEELARLAELLAGARLVTLTGIGGSGKSRLALKAAEGLVASYPDGVWLVELAAVQDPVTVPAAVLRALGRREHPERSPLETLIEELSGARLLLVLDNCEHVVQACADLAATVLRASPGVRILATSREGLDVPGEVTYPLPSLPFPHEARNLDGQELAAFPAVKLFVERARAVRPDFALTDADAGPVLQIVRRLDGIPLALELAAVRTSVLSLEQIAARLDDRFRLLTGGSRTALPRQQTLQAAMDWSHDLLPAGERALLRRLSVFAGGWTLEAAESVCAGPDVERADVLDLLGRLSEKSLVVAGVDGPEQRYRLLETVRQYGLERLLEAGEAAAVREAHGRWCLDLAAEAAPALRGGNDQTAWIDRLENERDNLRAGLDWLLQGGDAGPPLRLATDLAWFWYMQGQWREAQEWLERALAIPDGDGAPELSVRARAWAGVFAWRRGDPGTARRCVEENLAALRTVDDPQAAGTTLLVQALLAMTDLRPDEAERLSRQAYVIFEQTGHRWEMAISLLLAAQFAIHQASPQATVVLEASIDLLRDSSDAWGTAYATSLLGQLALESGDLTRATTLYAESLRWAVAARDPSWQTQMHIALAHASLLGGDLRAAALELDEASRLTERLKEPHEHAHLQEGMALLRIAEGDDRTAAELFRRAAENLEHHGSRSAMGASAAAMAGRYERHGRTEQAAALLRYALRLIDPEADDAATVRTRLAALADDHAEGTDRSAEEGPGPRRSGSTPG